MRLPVWIFVAALLFSHSALAQHRAFKDAQSTGGTGVEVRAVTENVTTGKSPIGSAITAVVIFRNYGGAPVKIGAINLYPSSNVTAEVSSNKCSDALLPPDAQCPITLTVVGRRAGPWRVEMLTEHEGRAGLATAAASGEIDKSAVSSAGPYPDPAPDLGLLVADKESVDFGAGVRNDASIALSLVNAGKSDLTISSISLAGSGNGLMIGEGSCTKDRVLKAGDACPLILNWIPSRSGAILDSLQISHTGARGILVIPVRGATATGGRGSALDDLPNAPPVRLSGGKGSSDTRVQSLYGYVVTSHATTRAVINGPSGGLVVRDGEEAIIAGGKWRVSIVPSGVILSAKGQEAVLTFDPSLKALGRPDEGAAASAAVTPIVAKASSSPPVLSDLQRIIP